MALFIFASFAVSLLLYVVFGGADFGAGMLEWFARRRSRRAEQQLIAHAIAPVWEANHVWLILAVVILFSAYPEGFRAVSLHFHLPLLLMLFGVILRGCAFTFRHYDPYSDGTRLYSPVFSFSSFLAPFAAGLVAGGCMLGRLPDMTQPSADFFALYVSPWWNLGSVSSGVLLCFLSSFFAACFLCGETRDPELRERFRRKAEVAALLVVVAAAATILIARSEGLPVASLYGNRSPLIVLLPLIASVTVTVAALRRDRLWIARLACGAAGVAVLGAWLSSAAGILVSGVPEPRGDLVRLLEAATPLATQRQLVIALGAGLIIILPALGYLLFIFKGRESASSPEASQPNH